MADSKLTALTEISVPALEDLLYTVDDPAGTPVSNKVSATRFLGLLRGLCGFRLTTESGVPVSSADRTAQATVYLAPDPASPTPGAIALYDGTRWRVYVSAEVSIALSALTSARNYDVFVYDNSGTLTLELSAAWTNDTTRADALTTQNGVYVKSGATTRRYLGTIRTTATTTTEDSAAKRYVWNLYNRVERHLSAVDSSDSWTYTTDVWREANGGSTEGTSRVGYVHGLAGGTMRANILSIVYSTGNPIAAVGVGVDSSSANSAQQHGTYITTLGGQMGAQYAGQPGLGYHTLRWLERSQASGTTTFHGDAGVTLAACGLLARGTF